MVMVKFLAKQIYNHVERREWTCICELEARSDFASNECYLPSPVFCGVSLCYDLTGNSSSLLPTSVPIPVVLTMEYSMIQSVSLRTPAVNSALKSSLPHRKLLVRHAVTLPSLLLPNFALQLQPRWMYRCRGNVSTRSWRLASIQVCLFSQWLMFLFSISD